MTKNWIFSGSKSISFFTIKVLRTNFSDRTWCNTLIVLLIRTIWSKFKGLIWINPELPNRKIQCYHFFLDEASLKCHLSKSRKELSCLFCVTSTNMSNGTYVNDHLLFWFYFSFWWTCEVFLILNQFKLRISRLFLGICDKTVIGYYLFHVVSDFI